MKKIQRNILLYILVVVGGCKTVMAADRLPVLQASIFNSTAILFIAIITGGLALAVLWFFVLKPMVQNKWFGSSSSTEMDNIDEFEPDYFSLSHEKNKTKKLEEITQLLPSHAMKLNRIDERLKALESSTTAPKDSELDKTLIRLEEGLRSLKESYSKNMGSAPSTSLSSRSLPRDMNFDHAAMVAVVNRWWGMAERSRGQLLDWCRQLGIDAGFAKITNTQALKDAPLPPYEIETGQTDSGGWMLCLSDDKDSAYILPVDLNYFSDSAGNPILVDMFGEAKPTFEYVIRACELENLSGGKFKVRNRGILQRPGKEVPPVEMPLSFDELIAFKSQGRPTKTVWEELNSLKKDLEQLHKSMKTLEKNLLPKPTPSAISESSIAVDTQQTTEAAIKKIMPRLQAMENKIASELNQLQEEMNKKIDILPEQLKITLEKELKEYISKNINIHSKSAQVSEPNIQIETAIPVESQKTVFAPKTGGGISLPPDGWKEALHDATQNLDPESGLLQRLVRLQHMFESYATQHGLQASFVHLSKIQDGQFELHPAILENGQGTLSCQGCSTKVREKESLLVQFFIQLGDPQHSVSWLFLPRGIEFTSDDFPSGYQLLIEGEQRGKIAAIIRPAVLERIAGQKNTYRAKTKMQLELEKKTTK